MGSSELSQQIIGESRTFLSQRIRQEYPVDLVVLGSVARDEATAGSDLDYLVFMHGLFEDPAAGVHEVIDAVEELRQDLLELQDPGATGIFGSLVAAQDLVEHIGLDDDSNLNHTRRILLLTESASLPAPERHQKLLRAIVRRYLADYPVPKRGVPRFLLNDILRYWHTLAVDYQAKQWGKRTPEWGLRYLKLIISRKLMIAGTVSSLFLCDEATDDYFVEQFQLPALARLAQVRHVLGDEHREHLATALIIGAEFVAALTDTAFRDEAKAIRSRSDIDPSSRFGMMQEQARSLQAALEAIFFDTPAFAPKARKYLSF